MTKKLLIEGWRGINHSYAMINQYHILGLKKLDENIYHHDLPYYSEAWNSDKNFCGFNDVTAMEIFSVPEPPPEMSIETTFRASYPLRLYPAKSKKLFVFGTSEFQALTAEMVFEGGQLGEFKDLPLKIITPSNWSKFGFLNAGFNEDQVEVIPHGVDRSIFRVLDPSTRKQYRALFGASEEDFIILNVGAMTANKGIDVLLDAFFILFKKYQNIKLVLKDQSNLYGIRARDLVFERSSKKHPLLSAAEVQQAISKICFVTDNLSLTQLNGLYNAADCYASPYRAEGFNLTPLEAAAAGTPIVITKGGSTDDYFDPSFAVQIEANKVNLNNQHYLEPNYESLLEGIESILTKKKDFNKLKGVEFLEKNFSWDVVCGKLYTTLMG